MRLNRKGQIVFKSLFTHVKVNKRRGAVAGYILVDMKDGSVWKDSQGLAARMFKTKKDAIEHVKKIVWLIAKDNYIVPVYMDKRIKLNYR